MKVLLWTLTASLVVASVAASYREQFRLFKEKYGKEYDGAQEEETRFDIFTDNVKKIEQHRRSGGGGTEGDGQGKAVSRLTAQPARSRERVAPGLGNKNEG